MALLLRLARRPLATRTLVPRPALYRPPRCAFFPSSLAFSTTPQEKKKKKLSHAERVALLPSTLEAFAARYGHFVMHANYIIPKDDDADVHAQLPLYPEAALGERLGTTLRSLLVNSKNRQRHARTLEALADMGFPIDVDWNQYVWDHQRLPAFRVYQELYGNCLVPVSFVVPTGDTRWPTETWGFKLGHYADNIKHRDHYGFSQGRRDDLDNMSTFWKLRHLPLVEQLPLIAPVLQAFYARHGHFITPDSFTVPMQDDSDGDARLPRYPEKARGQALGKTIYRVLISIHRHKYSVVLQELAEIGFPVDVDWKQYVIEHQRLAALRTYIELHGDCRVHLSFVVPTGDSTWPIETWGFKLGVYVTNIEYRDHRFLSQAQLDQLDELGFWSGRRANRRPKRALPEVKSDDMIKN